MFYIQVYIPLRLKWLLFFISLPLTEFRIILNPKYRISIPLSIENPVSKPMVPPIAASMSVNLAELSFVILSNGSASKEILRYLSAIFFSNTKNHYLIDKDTGLFT